METSTSSRSAVLFDSYVRQAIQYGITILSLGIACLVCAIASDFLSYTFGYILAFQYIAAIGIVLMSTQLLVTFAGRNRLRFFVNEPRRFQAILLVQLCLPTMALVLTAWNFRSIPGTFISLLVTNIIFISSVMAAIFVAGASNMVLQKALQCIPDLTNMSYRMSRLEESIQSNTAALYSRPRCDHTRIRNHQFRRVSPPPYADVNNSSQLSEGTSAPPDYTSITTPK